MSLSLPVDVTPLDEGRENGGYGETFRIKDGGGVWRGKVDRLLSLPPSETLDDAQRMAETRERAQRLRRLESMIQDARRHPELLRAAAWPRAVRQMQVRRGSATVIVMENIEPSFAMDAAINPAMCADAFPGATLRDSIHLARNYAAAVQIVHAKGYVIRDTKPDNIRITPNLGVFLIDVDSFSRQGDPLWLGHDLVQSPYRPPELLGHAIGEQMATQEHDLFSMAQIIFGLLFKVDHGFVAFLKDRTRDADFDAWIKGFHFPYSQRRPMPEPVDVTPNRLAFADLPLYVRVLFEQAFGPDVIGRRPSAADWVRALGLWLNCATQAQRQPNPPRRTSPPAPAPIPARKRKPAVLVQRWRAIAALGTVGLIVMGCLTQRGQQPASVEPAAVVQAAPSASIRSPPRSMVALPKPTPTPTALPVRRGDPSAAAWKRASAAGSFRALLDYHRRWPGSRPDTRAHYLKLWPLLSHNTPMDQIDAVKTVLRRTYVYALPRHDETKLAVIEAGGTLKTLASFRFENSRWSVIDRKDALGQTGAWPYGFVSSADVQIPATRVRMLRPLNPAPHFKDRHWFRRNGAAAVTFAVNRDGSISDITIASCPKDYGYGQAAVDEVRRNSFVAATADGRPYKAMLTLTFAWNPVRGGKTCTPEPE